MSKKEINDSPSESVEEEVKIKNSLFDFIEKNSKLISVLGVFTALTVFSYNLPLKPIGYALSFVFLSLTIIIWLELWTKFPPKPSSWSLILFENVLNFSILGIIFYWLVAYREIWRVVMVFPIWILVISLIGYLITRYSLFKRLTKYKFAKYKFIRILFGLILMILVYFLSIFVASIISKPINNALDNININIENLIKF